MSTRDPRPPDDFGLSPVATLSRVADPAPAPDHSVFWGIWFRAIAATTPVLTPREAPDPSDPTASHEFSGHDRVRIGAHLLTPPPGVAVRGGAVVLHGATVEHTLERDARKHRALAERGMLVLLVRVRGFPGSMLDDARLPAGDADLGWFARGLAGAGDADQATATESAMGWIVPQGVGDVVNACRVVRNLLLGRGDPRVQTGLEIESTRTGVSLIGESLGGGLAVIAGAQIAGRLRHEPVVDRLAIGLPSLGDWPWRLMLSEPAGVGAEAKRVIERHPQREGLIRARLRLCDSVVHASRVRRPVLCKLATRDQIVPAPTAAAVFNALQADPGASWRFIVPTGHHEGDAGNTRRHALFERCAHAFVDPTREAGAIMDAWEPLLAEGDRAPDSAPEAPPPAIAGAGGGQEALFGGRFADDQPDDIQHAGDPDAPIQELIDAYERGGRTLDSLPYTEAFDEIWSACGSRFDSRRALLHKLHNLRKAGRLPRLGRSTDSPPKLAPDDEAALAELVVEHAGSLGQRDRLPYTDAFDALAEAFAGRTGRALSAHDLWRVVAKLAK
mgnify:CR=1 FL=1